MLLELLRFYAHGYVGLIRQLHDLEVILNGLECDARETGMPQPPKMPREDRDNVLSLLTLCFASCDKTGLRVCAKHCEELYPTVRNGLLRADHVQALHQNIERELSCHFFVGIDSTRIKAYEESLHGWEDITKAFPASTEDIEEMNKCFALCRYSAAVFHSLLVVEHGLVSLGKIIGAMDPKEGWDASCRKLEATIKAGRNANTTGFDFDFLDQLNTCVQAMKLAWRNKINHATGKPLVMCGGFAPYVAEEIMAATRGFMRRLAAELPTPTL